MRICLNTRMENGSVGVARSTVDMHRVRVRNRASVGATVARRASPPPYLCMRIDATCYSAPRSYSATAIAASPHPGRFHECTPDLADFLRWRRLMMDSVSDFFIQPSFTM
ncbi:hypothetical protein EVAR_35491_1 [Eumeta japonica]|uniref:Uncharacterized protein n=1 Tax=Eumeta variegata TaxID=151549 RepID=A0A4C1X6C6_EUMVA|nr:hypothetical protein EVAR_35491_1 [Eumeta japonica]